MTDQTVKKRVRKINPGEFSWKDEAERAEVTAFARGLGLSLSNYVRFKLGLDPLQHGGSRKKGNTPDE